jgi:hypothetical protein
MTIIVCIKTIPDPEGPSSAYELHCEEKKVVPIGIPPVINPYDENALEIAALLKDHWGGKVIAVNMSEKATIPVLKKALSVGADELILLDRCVHCPCSLRCHRKDRGLRSYSCWKAGSGLGFWTNRSPYGRDAPYPGHQSGPEGSVKG